MSVARGIADDLKSYMHGSSPRLLNAHTPLLLNWHSHSLRSDSLGRGGHRSAMSVDAWDHSEQGCRGEGVEASNGAVGAVVGLPSQSPPRRRRSPGSCSGSGAGSSCVGACRSAWWAFWNSPELWWRPDDQVGVLFGPFTVNSIKGSCAVCCDERARGLRRPPAPLPPPRRAAPRPHPPFPHPHPPPTQSKQKKTLAPQWRRLQSPWRFATALFPYLGPPLHTLQRIWAPLAAVLLVCVAIEFADGKTRWHLDEMNNFATIFRYSSFVLSLLLAFRANRT